MKHGFYWLIQEDDAPEVVEIEFQTMYRCGSDVCCYFNGEIWEEFGEPMDVIAIIGPLDPPRIPENSAIPDEDGDLCTAQARGSGAGDEVSG